VSTTVSMLTIISCIPNFKFLCQLLWPLFSSALQHYMPGSVRMDYYWILPNLSLCTSGPDNVCASQNFQTVTVAGSTIATTDKLKVLGVVLDGSLTFDQHVRDTVRNCNFHLRALRHIRPSLTSDVANTIACSIIGSWLDYCNSLLIGISEQNLDSI